LVREDEDVRERASSFFAPVVHALCCASLARSGFDSPPSGFMPVVNENRYHL